jgi:hypothetical protein
MAEALVAAGRALEVQHVVRSKARQVPIPPTSAEESVRIRHRFSLITGEAQKQGDRLLFISFGYS